MTVSAHFNRFFSNNVVRFGRHQPPNPERGNGQDGVAPTEDTQEDIFRRPDEPPLSATEAQGMLESLVRERERNGNRTPVYEADRTGRNNPGDF